MIEPSYAESAFPWGANTDARPRANTTWSDADYAVAPPPESEIPYMVTNPAWSSADYAVTASPYAEISHTDVNDESIEA